MDNATLLLNNLVLSGVPHLIAESVSGDFVVVKNNPTDEGNHQQIPSIELLKSDKLSKHAKVAGSVEIVIIEVSSCMGKNICAFKDICHQKKLANLDSISDGECGLVRMFYVAPKINEELGWYQSLSCRERQILQLISKGYAHKTIAREINISVYTVNDHLKSIYRKMGVRSKGEASFLARRAIFA